MENRKEHWEKAFSTQKPEEVSWTQEYPKTSLFFIQSFKIPKKAAIIDIGGGDSKLADVLIEEGYQNITVLDISENAINRAKQRLGSKANKIKWVVSDITEYRTENTYDIWHDRATFHFLTTAEQIDKYLDLARKAVTGYMILGTFSDKGPEKCSGLEITRYSEQQLQKLLSNGFKKIHCLTEDHITPFNTKQNFLFCSFKRILAIV